MLIWCQIYGLAPIVVGDPVYGPLLEGYGYVNCTQAVYYLQVIPGIQIQELNGTWSYAQGAAPLKDAYWQPSVGEWDHSVCIPMPPGWGFYYRTRTYGYGEHFSSSGFDWASGAKQFHQCDN